MIFAGKLAAAVVFAVIAAFNTTNVDAGPISYTGGAYTENFDSLAWIRYPSATLWADDSTLPGWYASGVKYLSGSLGYSSATAGRSLFSYHLDGDSALGSQNGETYVASLRYGVRIVNNTSRLLSAFTLSYVGEQWRNAGSGLAEQLSFDYALDALSLTSGDYAAVPELNFASPIVNATLPLGGIELDGNLPENRTPLSARINGIDWLPGHSLWLRWTDVEDRVWWGGSALAIDDLTFTADSPAPPANMESAGVMTPQEPMSISEPSTAWLGGLCIAALVFVTRRPPQRRVHAQIAQRRPDAK